MSESRRAHQCHRDGCDSEAVWKMFVKFTTRTPSGQVIPCVAEHSIIVCDRHRQDAAEGFVSGRSMDAFALQLMREHLAVPHPSTIEIEFGRIRRDDAPIEVQTPRVIGRAVGA